MLKWELTGAYEEEYDGRCGIFFYWVRRDSLGGFFRKPTNKWGAYIIIGHPVKYASIRFLWEDKKYNTKEDAIYAVEQYIYGSIKEMYDQIKSQKEK